MAVKAWREHQITVKDRRRAKGKFKWVTNSCCIIPVTVNSTFSRFETRCVCMWCRGGRFPSLWTIAWLYSRTEATLLLGWRWKTHLHLQPLYSYSMLIHIELIVCGRLSCTISLDNLQFVQEPFWLFRISFIKESIWHCLSPIFMGQKCIGIVLTGAGMSWQPCEFQFAPLRRLDNPTGALSVCQTNAPFTPPATLSPVSRYEVIRRRSKHWLLSNGYEQTLQFILHFFVVCCIMFVFYDFMSDDDV